LYIQLFFKRKKPPTNCFGASTGMLEIRPIFEQSMSDDDDIPVLEFCEHGNLKTRLCRLCNPSIKPMRPKIEPDLDCPVWKIDNDMCSNKGCFKLITTAKQHVFRCSDCGWEWKQWKNGTPLEGTLPKIVECVKCNATVLEPQSRSSDSTCNQCGRDYYNQVTNRFG